MSKNHNVTQGKTPLYIMPYFLYYTIFVLKMEASAQLRAERCSLQSEQCCQINIADQYSDKRGINNPALPGNFR
ncbi:MAG: hypothetical protein ACLSWV_12945, partial [Pygmaiobacter massiliensis]